jgi:DNA-directed RNA polymerase specialized sigma24 family protein
MMTIATQRLPHDGDGYSEALDYDRLPEPWREWAKIARTFAYFAHVDRQDREDLLHNIIVRLAEVAEVYRQRGMPFNRGACIKVAEYTRLRFYHQKKRWKRVFSVSLNTTIQDEDSYETEMIQTIIDEKGIDLDTWVDFKCYYQSRPRAERRAIRRLVGNNWRNLSGYDWKQVRRFRTDAKIALA